MPDTPLPFTVEDLLKEVGIEHVDLHPQADSAIIAVKSVDAQEDGYQSHLWLVPLSGKGLPSQLTFTPAKNTRPRWSPDGGRIAFLSDRNGPTSQVFLLDPQGGEARQFTRLGCTVIDMAWRPRPGALRQPDVLGCRWAGPARGAGSSRRAAHRRH